MSDSVKDTFRYGRGTLDFECYSLESGGLSLSNTTGKEDGQFLHLQSYRPCLKSSLTLNLHNESYSQRLMYFAVCALLIHSSVVHEL